MAAALAIIAILAIAAFLLMGASKGGGIPTQQPTTTTTSPPPAYTDVYPTVSPPNSVSGIYIDSGRFTCDGTTCTLTVSGYGTFVSIVAYSARPLSSANATVGPAYITVGNYRIWLFGYIATSLANYSDTAFSVYVFPALKCGYIYYPKVGASIALAVFNDTNYWVVVPTNSPGTCALPGHIITVDNTNAVAFVDGTSTTISIGTLPKSVSGVAYAYMVSISQSGRYAIQFS
ncbi:hypothetical protein TTSV1_gp27 [Thermoproteus tenax spherical virus 1]|uniref:Uncharacterized protein n=1 Tax=Thermoproteus tenax spherical virus 1 TaxID=292639 RepID=Q647D5_9VIRU|nr:hypothetical protein TTSV1_gp27 [Thermoproteus tenax spherical virus 1]AAU25977.1 hypothetical protein [Thermoproteus tenax spherical virus 1]